MRYHAVATDNEGFISRVGPRALLFGNAGALDSDGDGLSDEIEDSVLCTSPDDADTDRDALSDGWEVLGLYLPGGATVDLPTLGAHPCAKDVFLQYDYEVGARTSRQRPPPRMALAYSRGGV